MTFWGGESHYYLLSYLVHVLEGFKKGRGICFRSETLCVIYKVCLLMVYLKAAQVARTADVCRGMMELINKLRIPWNGAVFI